MRLSARAARRTACMARGRGVGWLTVIEITTFLVCLWLASHGQAPGETRTEVSVPGCSAANRLRYSDLDTIQARAKAPQPASGGRPISDDLSPPAAAKSWLSRA